MSHDANAAKDKAKGELMEVDTTLAKDRAKRDKELRAAETWCGHARI